jgi:hypothetical protein
VLNLYRDNYRRSLVQLFASFAVSSFTERDRFHWTAIAFDFADPPLESTLKVFDFGTDIAG